MAAYFIDFDGVFFKYGTMFPTDNAVQTINKLFEQGNKIYFMTLRKYKNNDDEALNLYNTEEVLRNLNVKYHGIIEDIPSPRIIINDEGAVAINHIRNASLKEIIEQQDFRHI